MNKNIKLAIPVAIITSFALVNCSGSNGRLKRETYKTAINTLTELTDVMDSINKAQKDSDGNYAIPDKGTINVNFDLKITGSFYLHEVKVGGIDEVINLNNLNLVLSDTIEAKWDLTQNYLGIVNKNGDSIFYKKVGSKWGTYYVKPIDGKKYCRYLHDKWLDEQHFKNEKNYLMYLLAENTGFFAPRKKDKKYIAAHGLGFGISGFGGNLLDTIKPEPTKLDYMVINRLAPGLLTNDNLTFELGSKEVPVKTLIDEIMEAATPDSSIPLKANYSKSDDNTGATINLNLDKLDFTKSKEIISEFADAIGEPSLKEKISTQGSGDASIDYFVNFENNFLHQQEMLIDFNKANLQFVAEDRSLYLYINVKDLNIDAYLNETVTLGKFDNYKEPDLTLYIPLEPIDPDPDIPEPTTSIAF